MSMRIRPWRPTSLLLDPHQTRVKPLRTSWWSLLLLDLLAIAAGLAGGMLFLAFMLLIYFLIAWR